MHILVMNKLNEHESSIQLLKSLSGVKKEGGNGEDGMLDALETLIENLRKECYSKFGDRDVQEELMVRV